ncbi:hypothetical protein OIE67_16170 [Nonomuraea fuscirosea]|uniref:hypothetical protein n=1 Tax=Nonomuraea fuscirosea TaxID=1291556 RepID=UPI002DD88391|nr:hypothetical protein [Nonomuraea fuscirosea]WSA56076.1 hypothetical protein OIE67_16170 [Nonomuraea fuscirosea]
MAALRQIRSRPPLTINVDGADHAAARRSMIGTVAGHSRTARRSYDDHDFFQSRTSVLVRRSSAEERRRALAELRAHLNRVLEACTSACRPSGERASPGWPGPLPRSSDVLEGPGTSCLSGAALLWCANFGGANVRNGAPGSLVGMVRE